jgi:hypothetical protein
MTAYQVANWSTPPHVTHELLVNIAGSATISTEDTAADLDGTVPVGVVTDSAFDTGDISFRVSVDGGTTYVPLYDNAGTRVTISSAEASRGYALDPTQFLAWDRVRVEVGTQADNTTITLVSRPL